MRVIKAQVRPGAGVQCDRRQWRTDRLVTVTRSDMQKKSVLSLALATVYRPPGPYTDFLK